MKRHQALLLFLLLALFAVACGTNHARRSTSLLLPGMGKTQATESAFYQAELDALVAPADLDARLFAFLKDELAKALRGEEAKLVATPPTGERNAVDELVVVADGEEGWLLEWSYANRGDYNQDGIVAISDITPL